MKAKKVVEGEDFPIVQDLDNFDDRMDYLPDNNNNNYSENLFPDEIPVDNFEDKNPDGDTMRWMMNPLEELDMLELKLGGYYIDRATQTYKRIPKVSRVINDVGIANLMSVARSIITRNSSQAFLTEEQVKYICYEFVESITRDLAVNGREKYNCEPTNFRKIVNMLDNAIYTFMSRSINGNERNRFGNKPLNSNEQAGSQPWFKKFKNVW